MTRRQSKRLGRVGGIGLVLLAAVAWADLPASAVASSAPDEGNPRVEGALLVDVTQVKPGDTFRAGVRFRLDPGWHIYWKNPGDSGLETEVSWDTPGSTVGPLKWPFPDTFRTPDGFITTYGYDDEAILVADVKASEGATTGALTLSAAVEALVCEVHCIPAELVLTRSVPLGPETLRDAETAAVLDAEVAKVPRPVADSGHAVSVALDAPSLTAGQAFTGALTLARTGGAAVPAVEGDFFVAERIPGVARLDLTADGPGRFKLKGKAEPDLQATAPGLTGVLRLGTAATGYQYLEVTAPLAPMVAAVGAAAPAVVKPPSVKDSIAAVKPVGAAVAPRAEESSVGLGLALVFAFFGGALLNLMPCVFPVLALKAYGFTRMVQQEQGRVGAHAAAYAGGIIGTMLLLAGGVLAVRAGGASVGWGFQFQEPLFVAGVCAVLVAFALNLFGVFNVGLDGTALAGKVDQSHGLMHSAGEGVLAVVLATPCSAPLLGTAVGFAFAAGPATVLAVFTALGLGLALPFCVLVLVPGLAKKLPKPGAWMERFKQVLGFALLATTVWLVWVMGGLAGVDGMARLLAFLVAVGLVTWLYGQGQAQDGVRKLATVGVAAAVLVASGLLTLRFEEQGPAAAPRTGSTMALAQPWDDAAVQAALAAGQPVFIDFTADWCLTCKFNERTVLSTDEVRDAFLQHRVAFFVADWTRRDARITAKLAEHGRAGVPMYLVLSPGAPDKPEVLSELLTTGLVADAVKRAAECAPSKLGGPNVLCAAGFPSH